MKVCCICKSFSYQLRSSVVVSNWQSFLAGDLVQANRSFSEGNLGSAATGKLSLGLRDCILICSLSLIGGALPPPKCNMCHVYIAQEHRSVHTRVEKILVSVGRTVFLGA